MGVEKLSLGSVYAKLLCFKLYHGGDLFNALSQIDGIYFTTRKRNIYIVNVSETFDVLKFVALNNVHGFCA